MSFPLQNIEFTQLKADLIAYFRADPEFKDYNFEGSGLNMLISILAYVCHYNTYYLSMSVNESFLASAQIFKNVVLRARDLNYIPRRKTGAEAIISLSVNDDYIPINPSTVITIPKYTNFIVGGYNFFTTQEYLLNFANDYSFDNVIIRQGSYQTINYTSDGSINQSYDIENVAVDNDTLEVYVDGVLWTNQNNISSLDSTSEVYQIELTEDLYVKILFGDNILGKAPENGSTINIIYTITNGDECNGFDEFSLNDIVMDQFLNTYDNSKFDIVTIEVASGGSDYETTESIKSNAPKFYESQGRLVTKNDYISLLSQHQLVNAVNVYGGSDDPINPFYGKVYIAVIPPEDLNLTEYQKSVLLAYLDNRNILTIHPEFVDVRYIYTDIIGTIYYKQQYESQLSTVRNEVENTITNFYESMTKFDSVFKTAKLITAVNNLDYIGNTNLSFSNFIYFSKTGTGTYVFQLLNEIVANSIDCDIISGSLNEGFYDNGNGKILTKKSGNDIIGEVDYDNGVIEIYPGYDITITEPINGFKISFNTNYDDVHYQKNNSVILGNINLIYTRYI